MPETVMVPGNRELITWWIQNVPGAFDQLAREMDQPDGMTQFYDRIKGYDIEFFAVESQTIIFQLKGDGFIDSPDHTVFVSDEHKRVKILITNWSEVLADQITTIVEAQGIAVENAPPRRDIRQWLMWLGRVVALIVANAIAARWVKELFELLSRMM